MTGWCNTTVGFIDNEIVGPNPGIDDLTSIPFPCYNVGVSNAHRRGVCWFNPVCVCVCVYLRDEKPN